MISWVGISKDERNDNHPPECVGCSSNVHMMYILWLVINIMHTLVDRLHLTVYICITIKMKVMWVNNIHFELQ